MNRDEALVIGPVGRNWEEYFRHGTRPPDDFLPERLQPPPDEREVL